MRTHRVDAETVEFNGLNGAYGSIGVQVSDHYQSDPRLDSDRVALEEPQSLHRSAIEDGWRKFFAMTNQIPCVPIGGICTSAMVIVEVKIPDYARRSSRSIVLED